MLSAMEKEIQEIGERLIRLSREVEVKKNKQDVEQFDASSDQLLQIKYIGKNHPLTEHLLKNEDEFIKGQYIIFLAATLSFSKEDTRTQQLLLARIYYGADIKRPFEELLTQSKRVTAEGYFDFCESIKNSNLGKLFIVDSLMMYSSEPNKDLLQYISDFANDLMITKEELEILCLAITIILMQDSKQFTNSFSQLRSVSYAIYCYTKSFAKGLIADTEECYCEDNSEKRVMHLEDFPKADKVILNNITFQQRDKEPIFISDRSYIDLNNCQFEKLDYEYDKKDILVFQNIDSIGMKNIVVGKEGFSVTCGRIRYVNCHQVKIDSLLFLTTRIGYNFEKFLNFDCINELSLNNLQLKSVDFGIQFMRTSSHVYVIGLNKVVFAKLQNCFIGDITWIGNVSCSHFDAKESEYELINCNFS